MKVVTTGMRLLIVATALFVFATPSFGQAGAEAAYRAGDYASAESQWADELRDLDSAEARGVVLFNMGNAAFRDGRFLHAVARYTAAIDASPRDADYWANLELARSRAGLEAADRGDLAATGERLYTLLRLPELESATYALIALFALALCFEALRGGRLPRAISFALLLVLLGVFSLRMWRGETALDNRVMVVADGGAAIRSEPFSELPVILQLDPGSIVERTDQLLGWIRINSNGTLGWLDEAKVMGLDTID